MNSIQSAFMKGGPLGLYGPRELQKEDVGLWKFVYSFA